MNAKDVILNSINMGHEILTTYLSDFTDADYMVRPVEGANHAAWQLGHLITSEREMMTMVGCTMPDLPAGFAESYTKETSSSDDPSKFHKKEQYVALLEKQRAATLAALEALPESDLDKPTPESMQGYAPTVGSAFNILGFHDVMHGAQFVPLRRKLGKPVLI
ncbi:MAG: DinB family protein [bacterium]|nr:DinB family protein [bacterium]